MNKKITTVVAIGALALGVTATSVFGQEDSVLGWTNGWGSQNGMMGNGSFNEDFQGSMMGGEFNSNFQGDMMGSNFNNSGFQGGMMGGRSSNSGFQGGMMGGNFNNSGFQGGMMGGNFNNSGFQGGMMGGSSTWQGDLDLENSGEQLTDEVLIKQVESYLSQFDATLELGDLFKYTDTEFYVSVEDEDTGLGAFELLINPYTGSIRQEPGPNMMWNEEYSTMSGMHGSFFEGNDNMISQEEAMILANEYLQYEDPSLEVSEEGHQFSGYYTLHVEKEGEPYGMLSVHGISGDVWYHTWHGELTEVINLHNDDH